MKRVTKKKSSVHAYLAKTNVLETGSEQDIAWAKRAYWKQYNVEWRKQQRKRTKQYVIVLNETEYKQIVTAAKAHKQSCTRYIKEAALAYLLKVYLVPDTVALGTIRQLLAINYNTLQKLFDESIVPFEIGRQLLLQMSELEQRLTAELYHPKEHENG